MYVEETLVLFPFLLDVFSTFSKQAKSSVTTFYYVSWGMVCSMAKSRFFPYLKLKMEVLLWSKWVTETAFTLSPVTTENLGKMCENLFSGSTGQRSPPEGIRKPCDWFSSLPGESVSISGHQRIQRVLPQVKGKASPKLSCSGPT